ncbi:hypothetical protein ES702_04913 [subsurface metagenome]
MDRSILKTSMLITIPLVVGKLLDIYSTELGLSLGFSETNPVMAGMMMLYGRYNAYTISLFSFVFIGFATSLIWSSIKKIEIDPELRLVVKAFFLCMYALTVFTTIHPFLCNITVIINA